MSHAAARLLTLAALVAVGHLSAPSSAAAQSQAGENQQIQLPPDSSVVTISAMMPQEIRVGEPFQYQIAVKNVSDNMAVHHLVIEQQTSESLQIDHSRVGKPNVQKDKNVEKKSGDEQTSKATSEQSEKSKNQEEAKQKASK